MKRILIFEHSDFCDVLNFDTEEDARNAYSLLSKLKSHRYSYQLVK